MDSEEEPTANENMDTISSDICAASIVLSGFKFRIRTFRSLFSPKQDNQNISLLCYLSHLLNSEQQCDIAATGSWVSDPTSGNVQAETIVVSINSESTGQKDAGSEWEFRELKATENFDLNRFRDFNQYQKTPVKLETHIQDFLAVCKLAKAGEVTVDNVNDWIVGRCWSLMRSRVEKLSHWGRNKLDLIECLRKWKPARGELQLSKEFEPAWSKSVEIIFTYSDLHPSASGKYIMNASTAPKWIGAIADILDDLRQTFWDESKDGKGNVLSKGSLFRVSTCMYTLYAILLNRELQDLFGLNSLKRCSDMANQSFNLNIAEADRDHGLGRNVIPQVIDPDDDLPIFPGSYIPVGLRESGTDDLIFRYLHTLVAWQKAVRLLFGVGGQFDILSSLKVCCITLTKHGNKLRDGSSLLDSTKKVFDNYRPDVDRYQAAQSWIDKQLKRDLASAPAQVHAQAGLIALACNEYQGRVDGYSSKSHVCALKPLGTLDNYLPIGGTKTCCALCFRLSELIQKEMPHTKLELLATHEIIYPWAPPPHLPRKILVKLREELIYEVVHHSIDQARIVSTTSPLNKVILRESKEEVEMRLLNHEKRAKERRNE